MLAFIFCTAPGTEIWKERAKSILSSHLREITMTKESVGCNVGDRDVMESLISGL